MSPSIAQKKIGGYLKTLGLIAMDMRLLDIGLDLQTQHEREIGSGAIILQSGLQIAGDADDYVNQTAMGIMLG